MTLARHHRPVRFADLVGQNHVKPILRAMIHSGKVPPALLFYGSRGTGKTTAARIFAAALNCLNRQSGDACGECASCAQVQKGNLTSVIEIDAASNGGVDQVRRLKDILWVSHDSQWRVVILDEAHSMSKEAYNALLKITEEPPPFTVFVLVTTEPEKIIPTVRSRCMAFDFHRIRSAELVERLAHISEVENLQAEESLFLEIAKQVQGGLRDAVMLLDQVSLIGVKDSLQFREYFGIRNFATPLMWSALRGDYAEGFRLLNDHFSRTGDAAGMVADLTRLVSDLLVIRSEGRPQGYSEEELAERVDMAQAITVDRLVSVVRVLWDLKARTRASENDQFSSMEMGFALITDAVRDPNLAVAPATDTSTAAPVSTGRLSLSDIAKAAQ